PRGRRPRGRGMDLRPRPPRRRQRRAPRVGRAAARDRRAPRLQRPRLAADARRVRAPPRPTAPPARAPGATTVPRATTRPPEPPRFGPRGRAGVPAGRGPAGAKGPLSLLPRAAADLAAEGALPVNVRVLSDGEEETGGASIVEYLAADERGADVCVIFDSDMI